MVVHRMSVPLRRVELRALDESKRSELGLQVLDHLAHVERGRICSVELERYRGVEHLLQRGDANTKLIGATHALDHLLGNHLPRLVVLRES